MLFRSWDYFDEPLDDSAASGRGTWCIDSMSAEDNGYITENNINEKINITFIKYKVHNDKTIGFYDSSFEKELGTLDLTGGFETTSKEACDALVQLFKKLEIPVKTEETHGGSPNIVMSKTAVVKLLTMIKNKPVHASKIGKVTEISQSDKTKQSAALDFQIAALQKKKEDLGKQTVSETAALQHGSESDKNSKELKTKLDSEFKNDDFTLQKMDNGKVLLRYQYWAELPTSIYNKLKANYDIKLEKDWDEDTGILHMYFLTKKK